MKVNYHTHSARCGHARGTETDYVKKAVEEGLAILGFSDHAPFPDHDYGFRMPYDELDDYLETLDSLTHTYASDIILLKSLEIEYLPKYASYYECLLHEKKLDYLLLGAHFFRSGSGAVKNITAADSTADYIEYARAIAEAAKTGYFQMLAHPDLCFMNHLRWDRNCDEACHIILESADRYGLILEYNANGRRRGISDYPDGKRYMYPHPRFWKKTAGTHIPVIVGSDCHSPDHMWDNAVEDSYQYLHTLGIRPITSIPLTHM